jgi:hypothetical protein
VLDADLRAAVATGDTVEVYVERDDAPPPPPPKPKPKPQPKHDPPPPPPDEPLPVVDDDTTAVLDTWHAQRGATLDARIAAWVGYLSTHADSPYADAVKADLDLLRQLRDQLVVPTITVPLVGGVEHDAPTRVAPGDAVPLVFVLDDPSAIASAWLHYRTAGTPTYHRTLLAREDDIYLRGEIPADAVAAPGVEYFLEVVSPAGDPAVAVPDTTVPVDRTDVIDHFTPRHPRTRVSTMFSYADFGGSATSPDRTTEFALDVTYRLPGTLAGLSSGLGILSGSGGYLDPMRGLEGVSYEYGYAEAELKLSRALGAAVRLIAGVDEQGLGLGVEGRVRIGDVDGANLSFTASEIARVGYLTDIRYEARATPRVPVGLSVGITNRPADGDVAVRLAADVGLRTLPWLEPTVRVSYQGRTAQHAGLGAGLGLVFHW